ncbi:hypothetical protein L0P73_03255 [[Clostridium] innocuum]|uniref:hypothetical protein n=1 Tax=Clostridium innocuum TaxID=1522 RepID=UPI001EDED23C|nr:hypothetical protein [[Clostridium] innocuum]MCG4659575.1 hypothetical protein [[Clostridium] innocuum]
MDDLTKEQQLLLSEMYKDYLDLCDTLHQKKQITLARQKILNINISRVVQMSILPSYVQS